LFKEGKTNVHDEEQNGRTNSSSGKISSILHTVSTFTGDYHLFFGLKKFLAVQSHRSDQETKDVVQDWLQGLAATFFFEGIQKLKMSLLHGLSWFVYWSRRSFSNAVSFVFFIWLFK
jgi:hypothetical protein